VKVHIYNEQHPLPMPLARSVVCFNTPCILVELSFREICLASKGKHYLKDYVPGTDLEAYCRFFKYAAQFDHVGSDDRIFIVVEGLDGEWHTDYPQAYIVFDHFEDFNALELAELLVRLERLCKETECFESYVLEGSETAEYIIFGLYYPPLLRSPYEDSVFKTSPWRRLVLAVLSDYNLSRVDNFLQQ